MKPFAGLTLALCLTVPNLAAAAAPVDAPSAATVEQQMSAMRAMHERMVHAKTAQQRQALMAEHMQTIRDGMASMSSMMAAPNSDSTPQAQHQQMAMMQMMMQMMQDRMAPPSAAKK